MHHDTVLDLINFDRQYFHEVENTKFDYCAYYYFYLCEPAVFQIGNWEMKRGQGADLVSIPKCFYM